MDQPTLPLIPINEALTRVLSVTSTMELGLVADAILWEQIRGLWRTSAGDFLLEHVLLALRACPGAIEDPAGSGSWRRKRRRNRRKA